MSRWMYDVECYRNYFLIVAKEHETGELKMWHMHDDKNLALHPDEFMEMASGSTMVGFNSFGYDQPMVNAYLDGYTNEELKELSDYLIKDKTRMAAWQVWDEYMITKRNWIDVDVNAAIPLFASLKMYAGRIGFRKLQDLPIHHDAIISAEDHETMLPYCINDVDATIALFEAVRPMVQIRATLGKQYGINMMQKTDPQIAEAVLRKELRDAGVVTGRPIVEEKEFFYNPPDYLSFNHPPFQEQLEKAQLMTFKLDNSSKFKLPPELLEPMELRGMTYQMGLGGIHSQEAHRALRCREGYRLCDVDVASYYPSMIINEEYAPPDYGYHFTKIYSGIVKRRLEAKKDAGKLKVKLKELEAELEEAKAKG